MATEFTDILHESPYRTVVQGGLCSENNSHRSAGRCGMWCSWCRNIETGASTIWGTGIFGGQCSSVSYSQCPLPSCQIIPIMIKPSSTCSLSFGLVLHSSVSTVVFLAPRGRLLITQINILDHQHCRLLLDPFGLHRISMLPTTQRDANRSQTGSGDNGTLLVHCILLPYNARPGVRLTQVAVRLPYFLVLHLPSLALYCWLIIICYLYY